MQRLVSTALLALALATLLAGCRTEETTVPFVPRERSTIGEPRSFLLGFSDVPPRLTEPAYIEAYDFASFFGEALLVQRPVSWADFLPGARLSARLEDEILATRDATQVRNLNLVMALDPFDPAARGRLLGLPEGYAGRDLSDPDLRAAFIEEAVFIAENVRPAFLVLGTEVNATFERNPAGYLAFVDAYVEAHDAVKAASPETQVFVTFQYEELLGVIPDLPPHAPRWELLDDFGDSLDLMGITSYPSFAYATARKVQPNYYLQLREHTDLPIAFVSVGYSSDQARDGLNSSTPPEQRRFLQRLLEDADRLGSPLLVWFAGRDLGFAANPPYDLLAHIGLRTADDQPKEAWPFWQAASERPYDPVAAEAARLAREAAEATATPEPTETPTAESAN